jgi:hypothetical protein
MRYTLFALALGLALAPVMASAEPSPGSGGPSPELRAKFDQLRADAKTNSLKALSADHQSKIQAIVGGFNAGSVTPTDAIAQIDAILTPDESKAILDQSQKLRDARKALRPADAGPAPERANADKPKADATPDAGRILLSFLASPEKLREAMRAMHEQKSQ